jgi:acyl-CoA hydrolase
MTNVEANKPQVTDNLEQAIDLMLERLGKTLVVGMPLGLGKPAELINALYARACRESDIKLKILTALSLEVPKPTNPLEKALLDPFLERVFGGVPELDYMAALRKGSLPPNVEVCEFFFKPGSLLNNTHAQQHYISSNYTHAARDVFNQGCNVTAQVVAKKEFADGTRYSLSCNPDTGPELLDMLRASGRPYLVIGQVNQNLPWMAHDAEVEASEFDLILDHERYTTPLFSTPKMPVATADYMIGLNASTLLKDGGTLQVGIGALGDAVIHAALLRHRQNDDYRRILDSSGISSRHADLIERTGGLSPFDKGLYGATEMLVDGFMPLYDAGILKRRVYDFWALQKLLNEGRIDPDSLTPSLLDEMDQAGLHFLRPQDFARLQYHGVFRDDCHYADGHVLTASGERILANLSNAGCRQQLAENCLGQRLRHGIVAHGSFFLGPQSFYQQLKDLPDERRADFCMTGVNKVNQLDMNPRLYKLQRSHARFVNTGIMVTLTGSVVSDALENGQVISGVGGQYNFVSMAHQLENGRSIIMIKSCREKGNDTSSNIVNHYGHCTIPRHLRDIVVTEYGMAELRSKTDSEIIKALLNITDSRFQETLLATAKKAGKVEGDYRIPEDFRHNTPAMLEQKLAGWKAQGLFPDFPFGTDLTQMEIDLAAALKVVKKIADTTPAWKLALANLRQMPVPDSTLPYLQRLGLDAPHSFKDKITRNLLVKALMRSEAGTLEKHS